MRTPGATGWPTAPASVSAPRVVGSEDPLANSAIRLACRLPRGALWAGLLVTGIHAVVAFLVVPHPVAQEPLRQKVMALTESAHPALIVAGDSRAQVHIRPETVARELEWPEDEVINIGLPVCETSAVLAAYREFSKRFAGSPIMLISVSLYSVNDGTTDPRFINDETLWSMSVLDRFRLAPLKRALMATFLPEKALWRLLNDRADGAVEPVGSRGFVGKFGYLSEGFSDEVVERQVRELSRCWYAEPELRGIRWRIFEDDLHGLLDAGVQLVILDSPIHPAFAESPAGASLAGVNARYYRQMSRLTEHLGVPILRYETDLFGDHDPDQVFFNLTHLNRKGATVLSAQVGRDLRRLLGEGRLRPPSPRAPAHLVGPGRS